MKLALPILSTPVARLLRHRALTNESKERPRLHRQIGFPWAECCAAIEATASSREKSRKSCVRISARHREKRPIVVGVNDFIAAAGFDGAQHSAHGIQFVDVGEGASFDFVGEVLDGVGAGDGVDSIGNAKFHGRGLAGLRRAMSAASLGGQGEASSMELVSQGLAAAENGGERLNGYANDVVFRLLRVTRNRRFARGSAASGSADLLPEALGHDFCPEAAGGAVLGDFFEEIVVGVEEKRKLRSKFIDADPASSALERGDAIGESEGDFLDGSGAASRM